MCALINVFTYIAIKNEFQIPILTSRIRAGPGISQMSGPGRAARAFGVAGD